MRTGKIKPSELFQAPFISVKAKVIIPGTTNGKPNIKEELRYVLAYFAKSNGFVSTKEFTFNEEKQTIFEGIMYQAITLFNNGGFSKAKVIETHKKFEAEVEQRNEEKLSRTQELYTVKSQALKELGYTEINEKNATEVFERIAEIQSRKI